MPTETEAQAASSKTREYIQSKKQEFINRQRPAYKEFSQNFENKLVPVKALFEIALDSLPNYLSAEEKKKLAMSIPLPCSIQAY